MITGRYYADGGPWPIGNQPPRPLIGTITVTNTETNAVYHATENRAGYFRLTVPVGSYQLVARSRWIGFPLTKSAAVTPTAIVNVDLGIHMS